MNIKHYFIVKNKNFIKNSILGIITELKKPKKYRMYIFRLNTNDKEIF